MRFTRLWMCFLDSSEAVAREPKVSVVLTLAVVDMQESATGAVLVVPLSNRASLPNVPHVTLDCEARHTLR